uniref:Clathrin assembly protein At5g35200 n=1 Tax=Elaeis guineensis var. tenera TaxID=51953 RepID=A0A6J0PA38_ELAGV|nr:putative clathrin assembly protein At5g35200 [Elaeis guineensis]
MGDSRWIRSDFSSRGRLIFGSRLCVFFSFRPGGKAFRHWFGRFLHSWGLRLWQNYAAEIKFRDIIRLRSVTTAISQTQRIFSSAHSSNSSRHPSSFLSHPFDSHLANRQSEFPAKDRFLRPALIFPESIRKALGALKDSTTVGLAKVNSDYKELDIAIVKATNHVEQLPKEKHLRTIFSAVSASRPCADVAYCINSLAKRLTKTSNWAVALKTLIVIHRALREVDPSFREELINHTRSGGRMLNVSHFRDDSSPNAWDYSAWVRTYALYLEERLECFRILKYDVETENSRTSELDTADLLEQLPALQQLLFRLLGCQPEGSAVCHNMVRYALSIVAGESIKIYSAINEGTLNLVDKFFEMHRHDAIRALEIYQKAGYQAERLSDFHEFCKGLDLEQGKIFVKVEQPPASFIAAMEEYVKGARRTLPSNQNVVDGDRGIAPQAILAIEHKKSKDDHEKSDSILAPTAATPETSPVETAKAPVTDLLGLDDFNQGATKLEEENALALGVVGDENLLKDTNNSDLTSETTSGWELALFDARSSNRSAVAESKLAGGLNKLTLDSLYDDAIVRRTNLGGNYQMGQMAPNPFEAVQSSQDPFYASNAVTPPASVQMAAMAQQQAYMMQPQPQPSRQDGTNPFGNPYGASGVASYPPHNPYTGYM